MTRAYFRPIKEETVISVLHYMRQEAVREGAGGLDHIDALLRLRGCDPEALNMPRKVPKTFQRSELRRLVLTILRHGPMTGAQITKSVVLRCPGLTYRHAYKSVYVALSGMKARGMVSHEERVWLVSV
ncbi:hypothetical protein [Jannaschia aquimarina]|uniref:Uncharacterized protein n=1 Tax=Jannaschia aquimarina TaxID=935700 RepID=A0A0D1CPP4_9RHOB|nr:hypothetical protein [Jannaschia aquimarina]KIT16732.1 hypothetical protein jaqu_15200 [Jannaschia aquimarina]SNS53688.1 hypothetical protein SAMN05421775_101358 [Jannaschia aquimarina]